MPKVKISEYSTTNSDNTDIEGINIAEGCAPSGINNAIRELMVHLKEFQTGASGDAFTFAGGVLISGSLNTITGSVVLSNTLSGVTQLDVDNIRVDGNTVSSTNSNGNIVLAPNGTGDVQVDADTLRVGDSGSDATISSNGNADLILQTGNATTGSVTLADGANGNLTVALNGTGQVVVNAGAVGTPTIAPTGDLNTGIFFPAADTIAFSEGGAEAMRIDSSGNVGIGTSSPLGRFDTQSGSYKQGFVFSTGNAPYSGLGQSANWDAYTNDGGSGAREFMGGITVSAYAASTGANTGTIHFGTAISGTKAERMRINNSGNTQLSGNLGIGGTTPTTSGTGITFPATQSASTDANTLDDYEEGTWTPTVAAGYTSITYQNQHGWYTKVGRLVIISGRVQFSGTANAAGISIGSLPFAQGNIGGGAYGGGGIPYATVAAITGTSPYVGGSTVEFYTTGTATQITSGATNVTEKWISFVVSIST